MFKKVAIYGLAFGSASAAMLLVQYYNGLYKERTLLSAIPVLANLILPGIATYLFVKSLSRMPSPKPINMGKALFGSLMVCAIVAICTIAAYQHVFYNRKDIVSDIRSRHHAAIEKTYNADTSVKAEQKVLKIKEARETFEDNISLGNFGRIQFMMCLSTGMIVALVTFLFNYNKQYR